MSNVHTHPLRKAIEARIVLQSAIAKNLEQEGKKRAAKAAQELAEKLECEGDRLNFNFPTLARGAQMGLAFVNAAIRPGANRALAGKVADVARAM